MWSGRRGRKAAAVIVFVSWPVLAAAGAGTGSTQPWGVLPLAFEPNRGQTAPEVDFIGRGPGYTLFLTPREAVWSLRGLARPLRMELAGSAAPTPEALDPLPGRAHYLSLDGAAPRAAGVPRFGRVRYPGALPGIDLVYYGTGAQIEYDFVVAPGADPAAIRFRLRGADAVTRAEDGALAIASGPRVARLLAPVAYQEIAGRRVAVGAAYVLRADGEATLVSFALGSYDRAHPLVIDPIFVYSTFLGGPSGQDAVQSIALDTAGNAYLTGYTQSTDFPTQGPIQASLNGTQDAFVTKLNAAGSALVYSTYLGGANTQEGRGIAVDGSGRAHVTGINTVTDASGNVFAVRLNAAGSALDWNVSNYGGSATDEAHGIALASDGSCWIAGSTTSADFPIVSPLQALHGGGWDALLMRVNSTGSVIYAGFLGSATDQYGAAVALDASGNVHVTGENNADAFLLKLNSAGSGPLIYTRTFGGTSYDFATGVAIDTAGNALVTGRADSTDFPSLNPLPISPPSFGGTAFLVRYSPTGTQLNATYLSSDESDGRGIALDPSGNVYVAGTSRAYDLDGDAWVVKVNAALTAVSYATVFGANFSMDEGRAVAVDGSGNAYVAGSTRSTGFPTTAGAFQSTSTSSLENGFISKIGAASPTVSVADATASEAASSLTFTVTLSGKTGYGVSVQYATANGTATAGSDYFSSSGTLTFGAGETSRTVSLVLLDDSIYEGPETVLFNLSAPVGLTLGDAQGVGTLTDNDAAPQLTINNVTIAEPDAGTTAMNFTVTLAGATSLPATVQYATANGTAVAPGDYAATSGTLTFPVGTTSRTITVNAAGDTVYEATETFTVNLSSPAGATITDGQGVGTLTNDEAAPTLAIGNATVTEPDAGTVNATFTVTLTGSTALAATVQYATANGTAVAPGDYTATSGTLTFAVGTTTRTVVVPVAGDTVYEGNETYVVNLSAPANATLADGQATGTIVDDESAPTLSVNDVSVAEPDAGSTPATFTVTLTGSTALTTTVQYGFQAGTASFPGDFSAGAGTLTFPPGTATRTATTNVSGDTVYEANENFTLVLSNVVNATIADGTGAGTITNDDPAPTFAIDDAAVTEVDTGTAPVTFTVTLVGSTALPATVQYATANATATAPADYAAASGTLTFPVGTFTRTVTVQTAGDTVYEGNETFVVNLTAPTGATTPDPQAVGTITEDDPRPTLAIGNVSVTEGNAGTVTATFSVTLTGATAVPATVSWASSNGTAVQPADYTAGSGALTFPAGTTSRTLGVAVKGDTLDEVDETFNVTLSSPSGATLSDATGVGTITDDDASPTVSVGDVTVTEGTGSNGVATFTLTLSAVSGRTVTVSTSTQPGTATADVDYFSSTAPVNFAAGTTSVTLGVTVIADALDELTETFFLVLSSPSGATIGDGSGTATILDDDLGPVVTAGALAHGSRRTGTLAAQPGPVRRDEWYAFSQSPYASYEVVVDAASGDVGEPGAPVLLERVTAGGTILQTGVATGAGTAVSLAWHNALGTAVTGEFVRVRSAACTTACGADDTYRVRAWETTGAIPRFNNAGSQVTVLILQNPGARTVSGTAYFWSPGGALLASRPFTLAPKAALVEATTAMPALVGASGTVTVAHDGGYGGLVGKTVALESATGFSFDSPVLLRPR